MSKLISIVIPTYNQDKYLPSALDSVLTQDYKPYEIIVVNDGSTDTTSSILREYQKLFDVQVIEHSCNQGLPKALNTGFAAAKGEYLTWISSDNIAKPNMLSVLALALDTHPDVGLVYADWEIINEHGQVIAEVRSLDYDRLTLFMHNYINACFLYRRECSDKVGKYDDRLRGAEDWDYWLRISRYYRLLHVPEILYEYREHSESLTSQARDLVKTRRLVSYTEFAAVWRRREPFNWWLAKIRWNWQKRVLRKAPRVVRIPVAA